MYKIRNLLSLLKVYKHCNDYCCRDSDNHKWKNRVLSPVDTAFTELLPFCVPWSEVEVSVASDYSDQKTTAQMFPMYCYSQRSL